MQDAVGENWSEYGSFGWMSAECTAAAADGEKVLLYFGGGALPCEEGGTADAGGTTVVAVVAVVAAAAVVSCMSRMERQQDTLVACPSATDCGRRRTAMLIDRSALLNHWQDCLLMD